MSVAAGMVLAGVKVITVARSPQRRRCVDLDNWQQQVKRYEGLGKAGLRGLYDRTLPKQAERLLRPHGVSCEPADVYLPTTFYIEPAEDGYKILNDEGEVVGNAVTWRQAQKLIPDRAHELLSPMPGIRLSSTLRQKTLHDGSAA